MSREKSVSGKKQREGDARNNAGSAAKLKL